MQKKEKKVVKKETNFPKPQDDFEKKLFHDLENLPAKEFSIKEQQHYMEKAQSFAKAYFQNAEKIKKDKAISLRINESLLNLIKQKAKLEGVPYQTLINSLLHKYVTGQVS